MGFLSKLFGKQVNKAANLAAARGVGAALTFDSSADFPTAHELTILNDVPDLAEYPDAYEFYEKNHYWPDGIERKVSGKLFPRKDDGTVNPNGKPIYEFFPYKDSSTKNLYIDSSANMMYRWKYFTKAQWDEAFGDETGDPEAKPTVYDEVVEDGVIVGYHGYVPCAGGGGGDLYWDDMGQ